MQTFVRTSAAILFALICPYALHAQTQGDLNPEACNKYREADAEMNRAFRQVLNDYARDTLFIEKLRKAQRAWILFRDAHLDSLYPARDQSAAYGSVIEMCRCTNLTELTRERTGLLRRWVIGLPEGEVCSGSIKVKK